MLRFFLSVFTSCLVVHFSVAIPELDIALTTSEATSTSAPTVPCPSKENGQVAHPEYCDQFLNCWEGVGVVVQCEHSLLFNPTTSNCDYPANVECNGKPNSRFQMDQGLCSSGSGVYENPDNCRQFIVCTGGTAFVFNCPIGLVYNSKLSVCDYPDPHNPC